MLVEEEFFDVDVVFLAIVEFIEVLGEEFILVVEFVVEFMEVIVMEEMFEIVEIILE